MKKLLGGAALFAALALALAACGGSNNSSSGSGGNAPNQPAQASGVGALKVSTTSLGTLLTDGDGRTLYVLTKDKSGTSTCYGSCASNWPAFTTKASAGNGVNGSLLGTTKRTDGTTQVTYKNQPLYYFSGDSSSGDTNGEGVGGVWFAVGPTGAMITKSGAGAGGGATPTTRY
jgi:predicted lipoprotein with Yx(FWY)xxD motif